MEIIKISNTLKYIGDRKLLEINNLIIQRGEKVGIVGKNGVGKTTFLSLISGDIKQDEGKIEVYGQIAYIKQLDDININNYDNVFIGTPIWVGTYAPPYNTFLT